eukprot:GHVL01041108.1.p1 GENE.GHVL01041108.1~~GHVL01041108.1.p1  ORF type:complete len:156 (+),score=24.07 GHVL01041108.1:131-598(+)
MNKEGFLIVNNVSKRQNWGTLIRSATAFGITEILLVGGKKLQTFGSHGTFLHCNLRHFETLEEMSIFLKSKNAKICGIEIHPSAVSVTEKPFHGTTAFMLGNEGTGMSQKQIDFCDYFVYIPQFGSATASLNVSTAGPNKIMSNSFLSFCFVGVV